MEIQHTFGNDLTISPSGDIALSSGTQAGQERVLRRLMTNPGDYLWHRLYGGGLGAMLGQPIDAGTIQGLIQQQMQMEQAVAPSPPPSVQVTATTGGTVVAQITYVDGNTGDTTLLSAPLS